MFCIFNVEVGLGWEVRNIEIMSLRTDLVQTSLLMERKSVAGKVN